jgi:hypothetical protein
MIGGFGTSPVELMAADAMLRGEIYAERFTYQASWVTGQSSALGANATVDQQININSDSDFVIQEMDLIALTAAGTFLAIPDYTLLLVMAGSGRQIMSAPIHVANMCGAYQNDRVPGCLGFPKLAQANNQITCTLANRTGTAANFVQLALNGFKVFYMKGNRQQIFHVL